MSAVKARTTIAKVSPEGQVVLPASLSASKNWAPGTEIEIVQRGEEMVLRRALRHRDLYPAITWDEFFARRPRYDGPYISDETMNEAILEEAKARWHAKMGS